MEFNEIQELRNDYKALLKLANETDSKKLDIELRAEAKQILKKLQDNCPHNHTVILRESDYSDDSYESEIRVCLCCGVKEYSTKAWEKLKIVQYKFLIPHPHYICNCARCPKQLQEPLDYLLLECIDIVS